jgi:hypothetical protein
MDLRNEVRTWACLRNPDNCEQSNVDGYRFFI